MLVGVGRVGGAPHLVCQQIAEVVIVGINEDEGTNFLYVGEGKYSATIDPKTALVTAFDENGKKVFEGYVTKGGNMLRGTLFGKKVKFEGLCGL